jgi:hypothetical protein
MTTADWSTSSTSNTIGIIGTGNTVLTSPTYTATVSASFHCVISTVAASSTNGPRFAITTSGTITPINVKYERATTATANVISYVNAVGAATCASGCTAAHTSSVVTTEQITNVYGIVVVTGTGTISLNAAPSAAAANTVKRGSRCVWY